MIDSLERKKWSDLFCKSSFRNEMGSVCDVERRFRKSLGAVWLGLIFGMVWNRMVFEKSGNSLFVVASFGLWRHVVCRFLIDSSRIQDYSGVLVIVIVKYFSSSTRTRKPELITLNLQDEEVKQSRMSASY